MDRRSAAYGLLLLFALLSASRDVFAKHVFAKAAILPATVSPAFLTWFGSAATMIVFYTLTCVRSGRIYIAQDFRQSGLSTQLWLYVVVLNIGTLAAFLTTFLAIDNLNAYVNAVVDYGASPLVIVFFAVLMRGERVGPWRMAGLFLSFAGIALLFYRQSLQGGPSQGSQLLGFGYAAISCVAASICHVLNKQIVVKGIHGERVVALRFPMTVVGLGVYCSFQQQLIPSLNWTAIGILSLWSVVGIGVPLLLIIFAFEQLEVKNTTFALFLIPVFAYAGTQLLHQAAIDMWEVLAAIVVFGGVVLSERKD